ncbi:MAG TPA: class I SAM-dependent methyltransferase [Steroidobacteraceae bacterium]|nr:class I SAM-dependent methyltransferase [Steroidobacteraceae bacterium]
MGEWRDRLHRLLLELQRHADEIRAELEAPDLLTATRSRLKLLAQAWSDHARRLQSLLSPLSLDAKQATLETQLALRTRLPPGQDLASYYVNLHRDWVWGDAENAASHELVSRAIGDQPLGRTLVLGAGACRLAYDLHRSHAPACSVAVDINPLLLLVAARVLAGKSVALYEFPIAPRGIDDHAILRQLAAPEPAAGNFHLAFADALHPPFAPGAFDTVLTPWFIDILPADLAELAPRINRMLAPGGRWIDFGSLAFAHREAARNYSLEEALEVIARAGFRNGPTHEAAIPYMASPASRHSRIESVVAFAATKVADVPAPVEFAALPPWIVEGRVPVPLLPAFQMAAMSTRIQAFLMGLIDGKRTLNDMAEVLVAQRLMSAEEAPAAVRTFLIRMYEDARASRGR